MNNHTPDPDLKTESSAEEFTLDSILAEYTKGRDTEFRIPEHRRTAASAEKPEMPAVQAETPVPASPAEKREETSHEKRTRSVNRSIRDFISSFTDADYARLAQEDRERSAYREAAAASEHPVAAAEDRAPVEDVSFDDGFLMSGKQTDFRYGDSEIDTAEAAEDYTPPEQTAPEAVAPRKGRQQKSRRPAQTGRDKARAAAVPGAEAVVPDQDSAAGTGQADADTEPVLDADPEESFMSFREYLRSLVTHGVTSVGLFFGSLVSKIGITAPTITIEEADEDLGPESRPAEATAFYRSFIPSMRLRMRVSAVLLLFMAWISFRLPVTGYLKDLRVSGMMCLCIQLTVMLACADVLTVGIMNAVRKKPGAETMAVFFCLLTTFDAVLNGKAAVTNAHIPLCLLSSLALLGAEWSSFLSARALNKSFTIPKKARSVFAITADADEKGTVTLRRTDRTYAGFIHRSEEAAPDETLFIRLSVPAACISLFLTLIVVIAKKDLKDVFYIWSVIFCPMIPFTALLSFAWPYFTGAFRMFHNASAVAGWSGVNDIGHSKTLIITDRDIFPEGTVEIENTRVLSSASPNRVIAYAGTLITASGSALSPCFATLMEKNHCRPRSLEAFDILPSGGLKGVIDGDIVICGGPDVMRLMGVRLPAHDLGDNTVLLAANGILCAIFDVSYTEDHKVRKALTELIGSTRHPIFAARDFNVTPKLIHDVFDLPTDGFDFPPYQERFTLTESEEKADEHSQITALIAAEGLSKITRMAETGHAIYAVTRINMIITAAAAVTGTLTVFIKLLGSGVSVWFIFLYLLLWALPVAVLSVILPRI